VASLLARTRRFYGANPLHLLALLACFALAAYAAVRTVSTAADWPTILIWFLAAIIAHDLMLFPLYALADRSLSAGLRALRPHPRRGPPRVPTVNYLRLPLLGTGLLFLLFFPGIIEQGASSYRNATDQTQQPFLDRWLLLTAAHVRPQRPPLRRPPGLHPPTRNRRPRAVGSRQPRPADDDH